MDRRASRQLRYLLITVTIITMLVPNVTFALNPQPEPPLIDIKVLVNGSKLQMDVLPIIQAGRTLVPLRAIFEALGADVHWNEADRSVTATKGDTTVWLQIGNSRAAVSYELPRWSPDFAGTSGTKTSPMSITLDVPPQIVDGRTLVPVRFVSESLGAGVSWDGPTRTVGVSLAALSPKVKNISGAYFGLETHRKPESKYPGQGIRYGSVLVLVNQELYPLIKPSIETYTSDLLEEYYWTDVYTVSSTTSEIELKQFIRKWYQCLLGEYQAGDMAFGAIYDGVGVVMIGSLPIPNIHSRMGEDPANDNKPWDGVWVCDLYYTDMDGNWDTLDADGYPFISTVDPDVVSVDSECLPGDMNASYFQTTIPKMGQGGARPEIWLGHINAKPIAAGLQDEAALVRAYFERNHAYRHKQFPYVEQGVAPETVAAKARFVFWEDDFQQKVETYMQSLAEPFEGPFLLDWTPATADSLFTRYIGTADYTTKEVYEELLEARNYIWVESLIHSAPTLHEFSHKEYVLATGKMKTVIEDYIYTADVTNGDYGGLFYHIQGCGACNYARSANIGTAYLFANNGLAVIGNTTVGPHDQATLHSMLANGLNIGQALMMSQRYHLKPGWESSEPFVAASAVPKRYYQQVILGDPTLIPEIFTPKAIPVPATKQPNMDVVRQIPSLSQLGLVDLNTVIDGVARRLSGGAPSALRRITAQLSLGSQLLPSDPTKVIVDPLWQFPLPARQTPPVTAPTYSLILSPASQTVPAGTTVSFSGQLVSTAGSSAATPVSGATIRLYEMVTSPASGQTTRSLVGTAATNAEGLYTIRYTITRSGVFLAVYQAADGSDAAVSNRSAITMYTR
jgi:hypothetical protein